MLAKVIDKHNNEHIADIYIGLTSPIGLYGVYIPRDGDRITLDGVSYLVLTVHVIFSKNSASKTHAPDHVQLQVVPWDN